MILIWIIIDLLLKEESTILSPDPEYLTIFKVFPAQRGKTLESDPRCDSNGNSNNYLLKNWIIKQSFSQKKFFNSLFSPDIE